MTDKPSDQELTRAMIGAIAALPTLPEDDLRTHTIRLLDTFSRVAVLTHITLAEFSRRGIATPTMMNLAEVLSRITSVEPGSLGIVLNPKSIHLATIAKEVLGVNDASQPPQPTKTEEEPTPIDDTNVVHLPRILKH